MNKDQKIEEILNSLDGLQRAEADPYLYSRIRNRMQDHKPVTVYFWRLVTALIIIAAVNIITLFSLKEDHSTTQQNANLIAADYNISLPGAY